MSASNTKPDPTSGPQTRGAPGDAHLRRVLSLPLLVLYGLGVTIGAGIYVLIGATVGRAGIYAPLSFVLAAVAMVFSACSFAELSSRYPVSAGEAAYVRHAFNSDTMALLTGLLVITSAIISSAAICIGSAGYIEQFFNVPQDLLITAILLVLGLIAAWGIMESVAFAGVITVVEVAGLLLIVGAGFVSDPAMFTRLPEIVPPALDVAATSAIASAGLLAFFAFIGFEDLVNLAEEAKNPRRNMPLAIFFTLLGATIIYVLVAFVAVMTVPLDVLAVSSAPLTLVFERTTTMNPAIITTIAIFATLNGVIVQIIMASRVIYGLAGQGSLPAVFARIHPVTRTPLVATAAVLLLVLVLALFFPLEQLAEFTSRIVLINFSLVNLALFKLKLSGKTAIEDGFTVPLWVPLAGFVISVLFLISDSLLSLG